MSGAGTPAWFAPASALASSMRSREYSRRLRICVSGRVLVQTSKWGFSTVSCMLLSNSAATTLPSNICVHRSTLHAKTEAMVT